MSKRRVDSFIGLYRAILHDCSLYYPHDRQGFEKDLRLIISHFSNKGTAFFTLHLPAQGKILDHALSSGCLVRTGLPHMGTINRNSMIPRLFQGLWTKLFANDGCLKANVDANAVFFLRQLLYAGKKWDSEAAPRYLYEATKEFHDVDANLPPASHYWDTDGSSLSGCDLGLVTDLIVSERDLFNVPDGNAKVDSALLSILQHVADRYSANLGEFLPQDWRFRHGPGVVSDAGRDKFKYEFTGGWSQRLESVFPYHEFGLPNLSFVDDWTKGCDNANEMHSSHKAVPKTQSGPRLIAAEPTCHQWAQQCVADFLQSRSKESSCFLRSSISFDDQRESQRLALKGSLDRSVATIDLKSASDRLSCWLVQRLFRNNLSLLGAMIACRTRYLENLLDKKLPSLLKLRKFSTQGSALTFPVQSIVFTIVTVACGILYRFGRNPGSAVVDKYLPWAMRKVRVFGDDIICPRLWVPLVTRALSTLFLKVNQSKTHSDGNFRESCGMDAYDGNDVTPAYVHSDYQESAPATLASLIQVSNNFFMKGLWHTSDWLMSTVPEPVRKQIPLVSRLSGALGYVTTSDPLEQAHRLKNRWNPDLQRWEVRVLSLRAKSGRQYQGGRGSLLQYFTEEPAPDLTNWVSGLALRPKPVVRLGWVHRDSLV